VSLISSEIASAQCIPRQDASCTINCFPGSSTSGSSNSDTLYTKSAAFHDLGREVKTLESITTVLAIILFDKALPDRSDPSRKLLLQRYRPNSFICFEAPEVSSSMRRPSLSSRWRSLFIKCIAAVQSLGYYLRKHCLLSLAP
jgi:hypothetical protein